MNTNGNARPQSKGEGLLVLSSTGLETSSGQDQALRDNGLVAERMR